MIDPPILVKNRKELEQEMIDEYGYIFCQNCGKNTCGLKFEWHHIVFRSEAPNHPNLHDKENLTLLGSDCHVLFHKKKNMREPLVRERKLNKIFKNI